MDGTTREWDVVVVGAGIMGAATAWELARRGRSVLVLEQYGLDHVRGSSHGAARIFRLAYDQREYVRLALDALPLWREAESEAGRQLLLRTGGLDLGPIQHLEPIAQSLEVEGVTSRILSDEELAGSHPWLRIPEGWKALHQDESGVLLADESRAAFLRMAGARGASVRTTARVTAVEPGATGVTVWVGDETIRGRVAVIATAAWSGALLSPLGLSVPIRTTREHVAFYPLRAGMTAVPFIWHQGSASPELYGLPNGTRAEVKVGEHGVGPVTDPEQEGVVEDRRVEALDAFIGDFVPGAEPAPAGAEICLYAATPDDDFVIDRSGPVVLALGFGGHGFKFAPAVARLAADLVDDEAAGPRARFDVRRFAGHADSRPS